MASFKDRPAIGITSSLYLHIPFCAGACDYCDFYSIVIGGKGDREDLLDSFVEALLADARDQIGLFEVEHIPTVYIGGGTPSVLGAARMGRLLEGLYPLWAGRGTTGWTGEFTVEANPESAGEDFLRACKDGGVNRISLGVQSFFVPSRKAVRRVGAENGLLEEQLDRVTRFFPGSFSADLITGLPFQTGDILLADIEKLLAFGPAHVSLYSLSLEPGAPLAEQAAERGRAALFLPELDAADAAWLAGRDALEKAGYRQYEVSNFALPGRGCAHNIRYWRMENWLGAGPAASGTIIDDFRGTGVRRVYPADLAAYLKAPRPAALHCAETEDLDRDTLIRESLLMGFRCRRGPDEALFRRRFSLGIGDCIPQTIKRWQGRGFFAEDPGAGGGFAPSAQGLLFLDGFLADAFGELN